MLAPRKRTKTNWQEKHCKTFTNRTRLAAHYVSDYQGVFKQFRTVFNHTVFKPSWMHSTLLKLFLWAIANFIVVFDEKLLIGHFSNDECPLEVLSNVSWNGWNVWYVIKSRFVYSPYNEKRIKNTTCVSTTQWPSSGGNMKLVWTKKILSLSQRWPLIDSTTLELGRCHIKNDIESRRFAHPCMQLLQTVASDHGNHTCCDFEISENIDGRYWKFTENKIHSSARKW